MTDQEQPDSQESEGVDDEFQDADGSELDADGHEDGAELDDSEDVDYEGKQYKLPKEIKDALLRQSDYTRKTQEIAETRKALQQQQALVMEQQVFQQAVIPHMAKIQAVDDQLGQYAQVDWQALISESPQEAQRHWLNYQQLKDSRQQMQQQLDHAHSAYKQKTQENMQAHLQRGFQELEKAIPNIREVAPKLIDYANTSLGISRQEVEAATDPRYIKALYKAYLYDQSQGGKPTAKKADPQTPVTTLKARSSGAAKLDLVKDAGKMTADEWARRRDAEIRARNKKT